MWLATFHRKTRATTRKCTETTVTALGSSVVLYTIHQLSCTRLNQCLSPARQTAPDGMRACLKTSQPHHRRLHKTAAPPPALLHHRSHRYTRTRYGLCISYTYTQAEPLRKKDQIRDNAECSVSIILYVIILLLYAHQ